jgi:hypothetical protein
MNNTKMAVIKATEVETTLAPLNVSITNFPQKEFFEQMNFLMFIYFNLDCAT